MNRKTQLTMGCQDDEVFIPSTIPSTQNDINQLEERFDMMLYKEQALESGSCPKRRRIYDDLFNEFIRITKVHCSERGLLLERIKNESTHWINTYEELYTSSMAYSMRQYLYKMEEKKNLEFTIEKLGEDCDQLRNELEKESIRSQDLNEQVNKNVKDEEKKQRVLRNNVKILRSANAKIRRDLDNTLSNILSSPIFIRESTDSDDTKTN